MRDGKTALLRLMAQLKSDVEELDRLQVKSRQAQARIEAGAIDELDWAALGYTIHNIYNPPRRAHENRGERGSTPPARI